MNVNGKYMNNTDAIFSVKNVSKYFGKRKVVDNVSFDVYPGEIFGFLGPNGAGKSTTIKMALGLLQSDSGTVTINGYDIHKDFEKAISNVSGIIENPEMYEYMSGRKNLEIYARAHKNVTTDDINEAINLVHLEKRANEKVKKYSLGMKQRIGIAQTLMLKPKVIILDDPTNGLDVYGIRELRDLLKKYAHENDSAVIVSSHIMSEMQLMCDRVGIISKGRLMQLKTVDELTTLNNTRFKITVNNLENALNATKNTYDIAENDEKSITFTAESDLLPEIIKAIAVADGGITAVDKETNTLEDAFLSITEGGEANG